MSLHRGSTVVSAILLVLALALLGCTILQWTIRTTPIGPNISLTVMPLASAIQNIIDLRRSPVGEKYGHVRCGILMFVWILGTVIAAMYLKSQEGLLSMARVGLAAAIALFWFSMAVLCIIGRPRSRRRDKEGEDEPLAANQV